MEITGKVHCFFEQSGTFKNEFIKLGIPAEDYDIQNNFGETDHVVDLFQAIEDAYEGKPSLFDNIRGGQDGDLIFAFFPCIKFCSVMEQMQHEDFYDAGQKRRKDFGTEEYYRRKWATLRNYSQERFLFYDLALKLTAVCQIKGVRMIMENPWHPTNFTNHFWFARTSVIDKDRTRRGDYFRKPTAYWFIGCTPTYGETYQPTPKNKIRTITAGSGAAKTKNKLRDKIDKDVLDKLYLDHNSQSGICDEDRSMISPDYARNFICDFILGKEQIGTQLSMF
jgi:hypothetical protein